MKILSFISKDIKLRIQEYVLKTRIKVFVEFNFLNCPVLDSEWFHPLVSFFIKLSVCTDLFAFLFLNLCPLTILYCLWKLKKREYLFACILNVIKRCGYFITDYEKGWQIN